MTTAAQVPLSVKSPMKLGFQISIVIGDQTVDPPEAQQNSYWIVVVDRKSLAVVYNQLHTDPDTAPDISPYDTEDYMLIVCSIALGTGYVPQGALYDFLYQAGAGSALKRLIQINQQIGCGEITNVSYILVGILGPGRPAIPGIELAQAQYDSSGPIMTIELIPAQVGSEVIYTPARAGD